MVEVIVKPKKEDAKNGAKEEKRQEVKEFTAKMEAMQEFEPYIADLMKIKDLISEYENEAGFNRGYLLKWVFDQLAYFDEYDPDTNWDSDDDDDTDDDTTGETP